MLQSDVAQSPVATADDVIINSNCIGQMDTCSVSRSGVDGRLRSHRDGMTSRQPLISHPTACPQLRSAQQQACLRSHGNSLDLFVWSNSVAQERNFEIGESAVEAKRKQSRIKVADLLMVRGRSQPTLARHRSEAETLSSMTPIKLSQIDEEFQTRVTLTAPSAREQTRRNDVLSSTKHIKDGCDNVDYSQRCGNFSVKVERFMEQVSRVENLLDVDSEIGAQSAGFVSQNLRHRNLQQQQQWRRRRFQLDAIQLPSCNKQLFRRVTNDIEHSKLRLTYQPDEAAGSQRSSSSTSRGSNEPLNAANPHNKIDMRSEVTDENGNDVTKTSTASLDRNLQLWNVVDLMEALNDDLRLTTRLSRVQQVTRLRQQQEQQPSKQLPPPFLSMFTSLNTKRKSNSRPEEPAEHFAANDCDTHSTFVSGVDASIGSQASTTFFKRAVFDFDVTGKATSQLRRRQVTFSSLHADKTSSFTLPLPIKSSLKNSKHKQSGPSGIEPKNETFDRRNCVSLPSSLSVDSLQTVPCRRYDRRPGRVTWYPPLVHTVAYSDLSRSQSPVSCTSLPQELVVTSSRPVNAAPPTVLKLRPSSNLLAIGRKFTSDGEKNIYNRS